MWDNELMLQRELETLSADELRTMLHAETEKDVPDDDLVLSILHILEDREPEVLDTGSGKEKAAWKLFQKRVRARRKGRLMLKSNLLRVASVLLVICLLFAMVPQQAEANSWWQRLTKWTDEFFGFFRHEEDTFRLEEYVFETDNPGLQQVYDAVVKMGVTIPAVPMWLPEGYELAEFTVEKTPAKQYAHARFRHDGCECILQINLLNAEGSKAYYKDEFSVKEHERGGVIHSIMQNDEKWIVSWAKENIECFFTIDCTEDVLHEIIESIYGWRINE